MDNRAKKDTEKTNKYGSLRLELSRLCPGYKVTKLNFIIDVLGGWSKDLEKEMTCIFGKAGKQVLEIMLKVVLSSEHKQTVQNHDCIKIATFY